ncbi:MAG: hypothetical protein RMK90_06370, partial [Acetobacteraceae bacterium]|nr:hypothetical protein [Acetobacteraceae bacterium]
MARLRSLLAPLLAAVLFVQAAGAAAGCLRLAGGASLAIDICSAEASLRTVTLPAGDEDGAPPPAAFCAACHALPAAPAPPAPT